jgi:hypothetical protein
MKSPEGGGKGRGEEGRGHKSLFTKVRDTSGPLTVPSSHPDSSGRVKRGSLLGVWYTLTSRVVFLLRRFPQSRQSAKRFLKSSELGLPQPLTCRRVCLGGRAHSLAREGVGRVPIPTRRHTLWYSLYICTF